MKLHIGLGGNGYLRLGHEPSAIAMTKQPTTSL